MDKISCEIKKLLVLWPDQSSKFLKKRVFALDSGAGKTNEHCFEEHLREDTARE